MFALKKYADSNSSLQQQRQILYLLRHNSVQEFIAYYTITWAEGVNNRVHVYTITSDTSTVVKELRSEMFCHLQVQVN
jgi:hypothetical protein